MIHGPRTDNEDLHIRCNLYGQCCLTKYNLVTRSYINNVLSTNLFGEDYVHNLMELHLDPMTLTFFQCMTRYFINKTYHIMFEK